MNVNGEVPMSLQIGGNFKSTKSDDFDYSSNKLTLEWQWNYNPKFG
jgi:hypothetical protein